MCNHLANSITGHPVFVENEDGAIAIVAQDSPKGFFKSIQKV